MIKEHDEISEEDQDDETCNEDDNPRAPNRMSPYHRQGGSNNKRPYESAAHDHQHQQAYPAGDGRPTNRLGCSRAFHQMNSTKGGEAWKEAG